MLFLGTRSRAVSHFNQRGQTASHLRICGVVTQDRPCPNAARYTMTRYLSVGVALVLLAAPCQAQPAKAVDLVPDDSLGFLMIKNLRELSDKVEQTARKLNVEERVSLLELIQKEMGIREGISDKGSAIFIVLKAKDAKSMPEFVAALPVADRQKIAQQLAVKDLKENAIAEGEVGLASGLLAGIGGKGPEGTPKKFPVLVALRGDFVLL